MNIRFLSFAALVSIAAGSLNTSKAVAQEAADASGHAEIQEIIVTAQRRVENVQKSSLAIQVVGADELARRGVSEARDLAGVVPSVSIAQAGVYTQGIIRGVGDPNLLNGLRQTAVSFSVDGAVIGQAVGISQNFYDLARIEVLEGPQGTLYGRNATGGAVNLITQRPTQKFGGYITAEYGNFATKKLTGAINIPLTETLAVRGAFNIVDRNGYLSDGTDDDVRRSGRIQAYWEPNDAFNLRVFTDYSHTGGKGGGAVLWPSQSGTNPWTSASNPINNAAIAAWTGGLGADFVNNPRISLDQWDIAAEANIRLGDFATLTLIPSYQHVRFDQISNTFSFPSSIHPQESSQTTFEARLSNQSDKVKWTLGGYFFRLNSPFQIDTFPLNAFAATLIQNFNTQGRVTENLNRSVAGFGEAAYSVTDRLRVIGGLRYTHDRVSIDGGYSDQLLPLVPQAGSNTFNAVTWKAGVEFDVAPQSMAYGTVSRGYKAGGFFFIPDTSKDNSYKPEYLTAVEVGIRNRFLENRLQVNLGAFYYKYDDQQLSGVGFDAAGSIAYLTRNAGSSKPRGANVDVVWKATAQDTLRFSTNYTRARFKSYVSDYPVALAFALRTGPLCSVPTTPTSGVGGLPVLAVNCAGAPLPRTPEWSGSGNYEHIFSLANAGNIAANIGVTWATSRYLGTEFYVPEEQTGSYTLLNADLTYTSNSGKWSITAFGKNLTNKAVYQGTSQSPLVGFVPGAPTFNVRQIGEPRLYGLRGSYNF